MKSPAVLSLLGCLAGTSFAHDCADTYTIPTCQTDNSNTCLSPALRLRARNWFGVSRRTDCQPIECPAESTKCTPGANLPPQLSPQTVPLVCDQKQTSNTVTVSYGACPSDATKQCLLFNLAGQGLSDPKVQIQTTPLADPRPGRFDYTQYCSGTSCAVPIDEVLAKDDLWSVESLCAEDANLYIAVHAKANGESCWAEGEPIHVHDGNGNGKGKGKEDGKGKGKGKGKEDGKGKGKGKDDGPDDGPDDDQDDGQGDGKGKGKGKG
jgi:hypothetical protein